MQFIDEIYKPYFMSSLEETTMANYSRYIRLYIIPFLGKMAPNAVTVAHIQSFYDWMAHKVVKKHSVTCSCDLENGTFDFSMTAINASHKEVGTFISFTGKRESLQPKLFEVVSVF